MPTPAFLRASASASPGEATVGVVHIVIAAKAPENGLAKLTRHAVPSVLAGTAILENTLGHLSQAEGIVKLPVGEQPGIRGDLGTVEFKLQSTVKNDPKAPRFRFTHRVCHIRRSMYATTS